MENLYVDYRMRNPEDPDPEKVVTKLRSEIDLLSKKLKDRDYELSCILEDNLRLTAKVKSLQEITNNGQHKSYNDLIRELIKKNEEIKKLQIELQYQKNESAKKLEFEVRRLTNLIAESDRRLMQIKAEYDSRNTQHNEDHFSVIEKLREENSLLKTNQLKPEDMEEIYLENLELKERLKTKPLSSDDWWRIAYDVHKIYIEVRKLYNLCHSLHSRNQFSLRILLDNTETESKPSQTQLTQDLNSLKNDLNSIKGMISDFYAEQCGGQLCNNQ